MTNYKFRRETENGVLATDTEEAHGVAKFNLLVDLSAFLQSNHFLSIPESAETKVYDCSNRGLVCQYCGCDRAEVHGHSEAMGTRGSCRNCGARLWDV